MKYIEVISGEKIPALGLGTYRLTGKNAEKIVEKAVDVGYRHFDTAQFYQNEAEVGKGIQNSGINREKVFVTSKVWPDYFSKHQFMLSVEESLRKLKMDYLDLLLIHWPPQSGFESVIEELVKVLDQEKTRFIGVSNYNIRQTKQVLDMGAPIITNQVEYHPFLSQKKLNTFLLQNKLSLTAYAPIAQGDAVEDKTIRTLAEKYNKNAVQITLRWMMQQGNVMAIPKTANPERLISNLDIFDFELSQQDMKKMDGLSKKNKRYVGAFFGAKWD